MRSAPRASVDPSEFTIHGRVIATFATRIKARNLNAFATPTMSTRVTNIGASDNRFQQEDRTIYFAFPICRPPKTENLATFHGELGHAVQIGPGLQPQSPKNGSFSNVCRRLSAISLREWPKSEPRDSWVIRKRPPLAGLSPSDRDIFSARRTGWLGREDSNLDMAKWKSDALACPRESAEPPSVEIHK